MKRTLGLLSMAVAAGMGVFLLLHPFLLRGGMQINLFLSVPLWVVLWRQGGKWFRDEIDPALMALPTDDPLVQESISRARAQLDAVRLQLGRNDREIHLKFGLTTPEGSLEHIWCVAHHLDEADNVTLSLANEPVAKLELEGSRFVRPLAGLEDFHIALEEGKALGGYSLVAMAQHAARTGKRLPASFRANLEACSAWEEWKA
jgi:hypothetical protein